MKKKAWTLSELLITTAIVAVIFVVLTPLITKRFEEKISMGSTQKDTRLFTYDPDDPDCSSTSSNSLICTFTVPAGVKNISAILASGGGGGAGATQGISTTETQSAANISATSTVTKNITISSGMKNVKVSYLTGGGGGGGGGTWAESQGEGPQSQADCDKYDAKYLTASQNGGKAVCVTKWNIGDIPSATNGGIASSVTKTSVSFNCSANSCCWQGNTIGSCDSYMTSYSGCNRTVCTWYAANASCLALAYNGTKAGDWRLPTSDELAKWQSNMDIINNNQGDMGLRLCDTEPSETANCAGYVTCAGVQDGLCRPPNVWSSTANGSNYNGYVLSNHFFMGPLSSNPRKAYSARCVYEGSAPSTSSISGGGGSGAPYIKNYAIPDDVISANIGGKIVLSAGAGGTGGAAASSKGSSASNGSNGSESTIIVYNSSGSAVWGLRVLGGNGGKGATSTAGGAGGATKSASSSCYSLSGSSWVTTSCSGAGNAGTSGSLVSNANETTVATGGTGGGSYYSGSYTSGGAGGSAGSVNGTKANLWGSGSGGGTIGFNSSGNALKGAGARGANGIAEITYETDYAAAGGGGGGGGSLAQVSDIEVIGLTQYTVKVGGGGNGGSISSAGENGGESAIIVNGTSYSVSGGRGGSAGTSQNATSNAIQGVGGAFGSHSSSIKSSDVKSGTKGGDATVTNGTYTVSAGGKGGNSGTGTKGSCGGLYSNTLVCTNNGVDGASVEQFKYPAGVFKAIQYGSAGAGGGGGGWSSNSSSYPNPGAGAKGQNGYVYIYWTK